MRGNYYGLYLATLLLFLSCALRAETQNVLTTDKARDAYSKRVPTFTTRDANESFRLHQKQEFGANLIADGPSFCENDICPGLGEGFYLPRVNVLTSLLAGAPIYKRTKLGECAQYFPLKQATSAFHFTDSTNSLLNSMGTTTAVTGLISSKKLSFKASVEASTQYSVEESSHIMSSVMEKMVISGEIRLKKTAKCQALDAKFLRSLSRLPTKITDPTVGPSWIPFQQFLMQYGSHIVTGQVLGSKFQKWNSVISQSSSTQRSLQAKSCAEIEGTKPGTGWSVKACSTYSQEEKEDALHVDSRTFVNIVGGEEGRRKALISKVSEDTLNDFILSAGTAEEPISNMFEPIWNVIYSRFEDDEDMLQRSVNLQAAYEGWTAFKCPKLKTKVTYQEFRSFKSAKNKLTQYGCWNKKVGCNRNDDCHIGGAGSVCYCYGDTCIEEKDGRSSVRTTRTGSFNQGINKSCKYKIGVRCHCDKTSTVGAGDRFIWSES